MENSTFEKNEQLDPRPDPAENNKTEQTQPIQTEAANADVGSDLNLVNMVPAAVPNAEELSDPMADTLVGAPLKGFESTSAVEIQPSKDLANRLATAQPPPTRPAGASKNARRKGLPWFFYALLGVGFLLAVLLISAFGGYASGIGLRKNAESTQVAQAVVEQFQLGLQDMLQGAFSRARQRFEYVIQLDPGYPGASEKLAEVLLELNTTATPTLLPTATLTPTPDTRDVQLFFDQAQQSLAASDWNAAIESLLSLRKADPAFRTVEVDGMFFLALRNRGRDKALKEADLEGGIYDLTLASKFGPLDSESQGLLSWSSMYITGASFWGIDWEQAVNYFSQVAPQMPNLMDGSKMTATERLRQALFEYGNLLASQGHYCKAVRAYQDSLAIAPDPAVQQAGELAFKGCEQGETPQTASTPKPGKKPKATQLP
jgi:tetratricopeptide (TPR) repeat protein